MSADRLPERPNPNHLKRQAKELRKKTGGRLRDQVEPSTARVRTSHGKPAGIDYDHFVRDTIELRGPLTRELASRLTDRRVQGVKISAAIPADALAYLAEIPTLERIDLSEHTALTDDSAAALAALAGCSVRR